MDLKDARPVTGNASGVSSFTELVASRREWIDSALIPWCRTASRRDLLMAEQEWQDLAGRPDPQMTLWLWAWGRFPDLCAAGMKTINETFPVRAECRDGQQYVGYPDSRQSLAGQLVLVTSKGVRVGPISIDDLVEVKRLDEAS
jgi:hypothetical protein